MKRRLICITPNDYWQPKSGKPREIPISDALLPYLERALATTTGKYVFVTSQRRAGEEDLFLVRDPAVVADHLDGLPVPELEDAHVVWIARLGAQAHQVNHVNGVDVDLGPGHLVVQLREHRDTSSRRSTMCAAPMGTGTVTSISRARECCSGPCARFTRSRDDQQACVALERGEIGHLVCSRVVPA